MKQWVERYVKIWGLPLALGLTVPVALFVFARNQWLNDWIVALAAAASVAAVAWAVYAVQRRQQVLQETLQATVRQAQTIKGRADILDRRLQTVLELNRGLVEAQDEQALMDVALSTLTELVEAFGCSFVPVDEWDQPLPAFTHGKLPQPVLQAWAAHLTGTALQERCGNCDVLQSTPGGCPLHPGMLGNALTVICLPLYSREPLNGHSRRLGILHLYMPAGSSLDGEMRAFLEGLLKEIALAIETVRLREQELATLRQIQMLHAPEGGLSDSLGDLLDNLQQALEVDFVLLRLRALPDERFSGLEVLRGAAPAMSAEQSDGIFQRVLLAGTMDTSTGIEGSWLAQALRLPEGQVLGMLLVGSNHPQTFHPRQEGIVQTVAAQAALLVENERLLRSLEYKAVIEERNRLAREIHDGLAQTLAFLKLQSAQMQTYLNKGDLARLGQVLKDNYQTLTDAYLDTRQAIDNLRLTPRNGLEAWIEQAAADFAGNSGLTLERNIQPVSQVWAEALRLEIQAQLLRITQEALNNIRKHARASRAWIGLHEWQGDLVLEIGDNGRGFDADDIPDISKHGLRGMRERAELIGADFQIISHTSRESGEPGTTVRLVLPSYLKEAMR